MAKKIAIIVSGDTPDKAYPPFILATTAAASDMEVHLYFTMNGLRLLTKGFADNISMPGAPPLIGLINRAREMGVYMYGCTVSMPMLQITEDDFIEGVTCVGAATYLDIAADCDVSLYV
ncbi:DsrE/DsrF/DrsH-like family protein [Candidatus Borrarchaeum sp.]|uniref:DsrE/DsrF/DrsH-like family protein n=1 Tax=Candidatus Borrarchaeum sp. TaxID=2846742 RepID=UPI00257F90B2|nr:DsrE/DsrF/DrsH-like family protein [Candidatus Borrarchaeum sp.]